MRGFTTGESRKYRQEGRRAVPPEVAFLTAAIAGSGTPVRGGSPPIPSGVPHLRHGAVRNAGFQDEAAREPADRSWPGLLQLGEDLLGVEAEEPVLVGADLVDVDVVEAGFGVLLDLGPVPLGVGAADDELGDVLRPDGLPGLLEVGGQR